jgi:DNA polymerase I-like protein with 3'-5' exonuclease and polymerase domains
MNYVFDIETDGLLKDVTQMWIMVVHDVSANKRMQFLQGDMNWIQLFNNARQVMGHNIIGYDLAVLKKLFNYELPKSVKAVDTLILSQVLDYRRFGNDGHGLKRWGEYLEFPKQEFEDWSGYSEQMGEYCNNDVSLNVKVLEILKQELIEVSEKNPKVKEYIKVEHAVSKWCAEANLGGWPFDLDKAHILYDRLQVEMDKTYTALNSKLGLKIVAVDKKLGIVEVKKPKYRKDGCYDAHTARWFDVDPWSGFDPDDRIVDGEYCRIQVEPLSLDSVTDVKIFLYRHGWVPNDWNYKADPITGRKAKTTPKITEDSLEFLGGDGKLYKDFLTAKARQGILTTWLKNVDDQGNLHGDCMTIGTPSMRARHSIIVNVPSGDSPWGREMRELFSCKPGWKLVGCDSSGNQARGLAHYLNNPTFIDTLLNGDIHQFNADILTEILKKDLKMNYVVPRANAKRILYAFLFGASGGKLWSYIFGSHDDVKGKKLKSGFIKAVPGFKDLSEKLEKIYGNTKKKGDGYIPSLAGTRVYVDSFHKLLVYLLQSAEKITCGAACMLTMERLESAGIPYQPLIMMHDEIDFMVPEEFAEQAAEIGKQAFADGPKLFGVEIMDGSGKIGNDWYEIH